MAYRRTTDEAHIDYLESELADRDATIAILENNYQESVDECEALNARLDEYEYYYNCLHSAGIDNCEAFSYAMQEFYREFPDASI